MRGIGVSAITLLLTLGLAPAPSSAISRAAGAGAGAAMGGQAGSARQAGWQGVAWVWPVRGAVVRPFVAPPQPWLAGHRGADLAAAEGTPVRAAGAGEVVFAGVIVDRPVISVAHSNGTRTTYEPVEPLVRAGEPVAAGQIIGTLRAGHAGCPDVCLHWGLRRGQEYLDPLGLVGRGRVRLLPLAGRAAPRRAARSRRECCRSGRRRAASPDPGRD
jgi:murein DD-endopeptidase MepM/ murein hydrolase activator NlpD